MRVQKAPRLAFHQIVSTLHPSDAGHLLQWQVSLLTFAFPGLWSFFVVMITPIILNRLEWKGYLIFMVLNFLFVPLVYFCYPETANLPLEEIDYVFTDHSQNAVKLSKQMRKERVKFGRRDSFVQETGVSRRGSLTSVKADNTVTEHAEKA